MRGGINNEARDLIATKCQQGAQGCTRALLKSLWKNLERGGIKWKNIPNFVLKRERR